MTLSSEPSADNGFAAVVAESLSAALQPWVTTGTTVQVSDPRAAENPLQCSLLLQAFWHQINQAVWRNAGAGGEGLVLVPTPDVHNGGFTVTVRISEVPSNVVARRELLQRASRAVEIAKSFGPLVQSKDMVEFSRFYLGALHGATDSPQYLWFEELLRGDYTHLLAVEPDFITLAWWHRPDIQEKVLELLFQEWAKFTEAPQL
ncbi:hypothetical protein LC612_36195 [Nostoc sp. CHAB 5834]|nr:hypothetical protein [Nostoc sp. CHAB 5834]